MTKMLGKLSDADYNALDAVRSSDLGHVLKSMSTKAWSDNCPAPGSDATRLGTALHTAVLEPCRYAHDYVTIPKFDLRTKQGKEDSAAFIDSLVDKMVLSRDESALVYDMQKSLHAHPFWTSFADVRCDDGQLIECAMSAKLDGVQCKIKPDRVVFKNAEGLELERPIIIDLKKTDDIKKFGWSMLDYGYHRQAAFYQAIFAKVYENSPPPRFVLAVVGQKKEIGRHPVRIFEPSPDLLELGLSEVMRSLQVIKLHMTFGTDPIFDTEIIDKRAK